MTICEVHKYKGKNTEYCDDVELAEGEIASCTFDKLVPELVCVAVPAGGGGGGSSSSSVNLDVENPSISWDTTIESGSNYVSPLQAGGRCTKAFTVNVMFQVSAQDDNSDDEMEDTAEDVVTEEEVMDDEVVEDTPPEGVEEEVAAEVEYEPLEVEPLGASLVPPGEVDEELDSDEVSVEVSEDVVGFEFEAEEETEPKVEEEGVDLPPFENCPWCREELPQQARVRFCPFCGSNVNLVPCPECGEELRLNWRFCIACGTEVES